MTDEYQSGANNVKIMDIKAEFHPIFLALNYDDVRTLHGFSFSFHLWISLAADFNSSPPGPNGRHFTDNIFRYICVNDKFCILINISQKFVPKGPIDNNLALV